MHNGPDYTTAREVMERKEPIRLIDGSYPGGFIPVLTLIQLIYDGEAEEYRKDGKTFVKAKDHALQT